MKKFFIISLLVLNAVTQVMAQEKITITVVDTSGSSLPYPEVMIGKSFHRAGDINGAIEVALESFVPNDTLTVKYIGYKPAHLILDSTTITRSVVAIILEEETYNLDAVTISPSEYSSDSYFKKKKKWLLLPCRRFSFDLDFIYAVYNQPEHKYIGHMSGVSDSFTTNIDSASFVISEIVADTCEIIKIGKRATEISYLVTYAFCHKADRSNFYCTYKGKTDDSEVWEFVIRKQPKMPWGLKEDDELRCIVTLDNDGFFTNIKTHYTSSTNDVSSYLMYTDYGRYDNQIIPLSTELHIVPGANNDKMVPVIYSFTYNNFSKKK